VALVSTSTHLDLLLRGVFLISGLRIDSYGDSHIQNRTNLLISWEVTILSKSHETAARFRSKAVLPASLGFTPAIMLAGMNMSVPGSLFTTCLIF
jgi:hypothetical protein